MVTYSKTENKTGSAFCVFREETQIYSWYTRLSPENSVFQMELDALKNAICLDSEKKYIITNYNILKCAYKHLCLTMFYFFKYSDTDNIRK